MEMQSNQLKKISLTILMGVLAAICCIGLLLVSGLISQKSIVKNAKSSAAYFEETALFEDVLKNRPSVKRDNYADCISFSIAYHLGNTEAIEGTNRNNLFIRVLEARYTQAEGENVNDGFARAVNEGETGNVTYSRYWHGGAAVIRLLMPVFSVQGMRIIFLVLGILLNVAWLGYLVYRKEYALGIAYTVGIFFGKLFFAYTCFEYAFVCLMVPVFSFLVYRKGEKEVSCNIRKDAKNESRKGMNGLPLTGLFLIFGILTCFFDFLTAETLTFTIPMLVLLICLSGKKKNYTILKEGETKESPEKERIKNLWKTFLVNGSFWALGYAGMFCLKWFLSFLLLGGEESKTTFFYLAERSVGEVHQGANLASPIVSWPVRIAEILLRNLAALAGIPENLNKVAQILILCGIAVAAGLLWYFLRKPSGKENEKAGMQKNNKRSVKSQESNKKGKQALTSFPVFLVLSLIPFLRFFVLSNHAYQHYFFTYRALMPVVMIVVYFFIKTTILDNLFDSKQK